MSETTDVWRQHLHPHHGKVSRTADKDNVPVIVVLDLPAAFLIDGLVATGHGLVADDVNLVAVRADELLQDAADDGRHAGRDDDGRDVVGQRPLEVFVEVRVEGDVLHQVVDALREGARDRVHHLAESVPGRSVVRVEFVVVEC